MDTKDDRIKTLDKRMAKLTRRIEQLERLPQRRFKRSADTAAAPLALVEHLRAFKTGRYRAEGMHGAVAYAGAVTFGERQYLWTREHPLPGIDKIEPDRLSRALVALGHPTRLMLVRALLKKAHTSQELQALFEASSPGPLYHHLKELLAVGIVTQARRSHYAIRAQQVVPLLTVLAAAFDLTDTDTAPPDFELPSQEEE